MFVVVVALAIASTIYASAKLSALPNPGAAPVLAKSVVFLDRNGNVLAEHNPQGQFHIVQRIGEMGKWAPLATVGAEDRDFYKHGALDPTAVARAIVVDTLSRKPLQGGSTISQQLVKITVLQSDKTFSRKLKEAVIANQMEHRYTKDQILEMYLNRVYYGHGAYGIGSATKTYFGRAMETKNLTIGQAAFLAGMINAPSGNDPQVHWDRARARQLYVLGQMVQGASSPGRSPTRRPRRDIQKELVYDTGYRESKAPHFIDYVTNKLEAQFGTEAMQQGGLTIRTTLDPNLQSLAEQSVAKGVQAMAYEGVNNGDLLAARPSTGEILAWVGSADYANQAIGGQFDVIRSPRQPGSSFKPYVYEAALKDHKITLNSCVQDVPTTFPNNPPFTPRDFDNSYMGTLTARQSLLLSRNIPAVQVAQKEGMANVINLANTMGIRSTLPPGLATAIGGGGDHAGPRAGLLGLRRRGQEDAPDQHHQGHRFQRRGAVRRRARPPGQAAAGADRGGGLPHHGRPQGLPEPVEPGVETADGGQVRDHRGQHHRGPPGRLDDGLQQGRRGGGLGGQHRPTAPAGRSARSASTPARRSWPASSTGSRPT